MGSLIKLALISLSKGDLLLFGAFFRENGRYILVLDMVFFACLVAK